MSSIFDPLVQIIHSGTLDSWKDESKLALAALFGTRYAKRAEKAVALRAPDMGGGDSGVPYAAYIHPSNADAGAYGGMSFVIFPVEGEPCLVAMVIGAQGLAPDEAVLGRPGHSRKLQAISTWLNHQFGGGNQVEWTKQDPTRVDIDVPESLQRSWSAYERVFKRYGRYLYALYKPTEEEAGTIAALTAMLDLMFEERGHSPLKEFQDDSASTRSAWFSHLMPKTDNKQVVELLKNCRYVVLQGPQGPGKLEWHGRSWQVNTAASDVPCNFIRVPPTRTSWAAWPPCRAVEMERGPPGFRFAPKPGFLLEAAAQAADAAKPYLLHIVAHSAGPPVPPV